MTISSVPDNVIQCFSEVRGLTEATDFEVHCLWLGYHERGKWTEHILGNVVTVGAWTGRPIVVAFRYADYNGQRLCFWHATSQLVDYEIVREFLDKAFPNVPRTDAANFHNVLAERY